jgi:tetratricopeptide (TPR) repeat protein
MRRRSVTGIGVSIGLSIGIALLAGACSEEDVAENRNVAAAGKPEMTVAGDSGVTSIYGSYLSGRFAESRSDLDRAAELIARVLEANPENETLLRRAFILNLGAGKTDKAVEYANRLVEAGGALSTANLLLAARDLKAGQLEQAEKSLARMSDRGFEKFTKMLTESWIHAAGGKYDAAVKILDTLGKEKGFGVLAGLHAAFVEELAGRPEAAENRYRKIVKDPKEASARLLWSFAALLQRRGKQDEAIKLFGAKLAENSDSILLVDGLAQLKAGTQLPPLVASPVQGLSEAIFNLASALPRDRAEDVILLYTQVSLDLTPDFALGHLLVGDILAARERYEAAAAVYGKVKKVSPFSWSARLRTADALYELKRLDDSVKLLEAMADERPKRTDALLKLGNFLRYKEKFEKAVGAYDQAFERLEKPNAQQWSLYYSRGIALERSNQWNRAEKDFLKALEFKPEQPYVLNYLGYSWVEKGKNIDKARAMIERAVQQRQNDGYIVDSMGWVLYRLGKYEESVAHLERAVQLRPQDPVINDHLGDAYWRVGRRHEARFQWRRALSFKPEKKDSDKIEVKLKEGLGKAEPIKEADSGG